MSEEKKTNEVKNTTPDELTKTKKPGDVQLNQEDLAKVSGGAGKVSLSDFSC